MLISTLLACSPVFERPDDPGLAGGPVGVRTVEVGGRPVEVWYPAHPRHADEPGEAVSFTDILAPAVLDRLSDLEVPEIPTVAVRDAEVHPDGPFGAVIFSHGFGGSRIQSVGLTTHLASRGFVVVATDHEGRSLTELVPCMFSPPMEGCALAFDDPGPPDILTLAEWLEAPPAWLEGSVQAAGFGLMGHSAGGVSTTTVGNTDPRFNALVPMAGGDAVTRDDVAVQRWAGTCDGIVPAAGSAEAHEASATGAFLELEGAGHLAFSDLCTLDLGGLIDDLSGRDDVSAAFLEQSRQLATDGCPGASPVPELEACDTFLPLEVSDPILSGAIAAFFEQVLLGEGAGPPGASSGVLVVR